MKIKTRELTGPTLDWAVAKVNNLHPELGIYRWVWYQPSTNWSQGGPIVDEHSISVIRCDDEYEVDKRGFTTRKRIPVWAATTGQHGLGESYNSYGEPCGSSYELSESEMMYGSTPLIAAMRCYVAGKLGEEVEIPDELLA